MKVRLALVLLLAALALAAPGKPFVDKKAGYRLSPPAGWKSQADQARQIQASSVFIGVEQGGFMANINVMIQPVGKLDEFTRITKEQLKSAKAVIISEKSVKCGSTAGHQMIWKMPMQGKKLQFHSTWFVARGKTYLFTGTSLESKWSGVSKLFAESAASFQPVP